MAGRCTSRRSAETQTSAVPWLPRAIDPCGVRQHFLPRPHALRGSSRRWRFAAQVGLYCFRRNAIRSDRQVLLHFGRLENKMNTPTRSALLSAILLATASACFTKETTSDAVAVHDSAGVRVVEIPDSISLPTWSIDTVPETVIGDRPHDPAHELFRVRAAIRLSDGDIAIASQGSSDIRIFDASGDHLRTFGRKGQGPGEFAFLNGMVAAGDSLFVYDWQQQRASEFSLTGELLRTIHLPFTRAASVGRLSDGAFVSTSFLGGVPRRPRGTQRDSTAIEIIHPSAGKDTIAAAIALEWYSHGDNGVPTILPFAKHTYVAAAGEYVDVAVSDETGLRRYASNGVLKRVVRIERAPQAITDADWERAKGIFLGDFPEQLKPEQEERWKSVPRAGHLPFFRGLVADADGDIWVREFSIGTAWTTWLVIQPDGLPWGRVRIPTGTGLMQAGRDRVVLLRNADQGQTVSVHRLSR